MKVKLWYKGFTVVIVGDCDVAMKAVDIIVKLIGKFNVPGIKS